MNNLNFISASTMIDNPDLFSYYIGKSFVTTKFLEKFYPNYFSWYYTVVIPGLFDSSRDIFLAIDNKKIIGIAICKNTKYEHKLCTLWVNSEYRGKGIGTKLLYLSFQYLETTTPFITINETSLKYFKEIIKRYNWKLTKRIPNAYTTFTEYEYNGKDVKEYVNPTFEDLYHKAR